MAEHQISNSKPSKIIAIIGNQDIALFRGWLIRDLVISGHRVIAFGPDAPGLASAVAGYGAKFCPISFDRTSINPFRNLSYVIKLRTHLRQESVDIVLSHSTKGNLIGTLAAVLARSPHIFAMIEGLGYAFASTEGVKRRCLRGVLTQLFRLLFPICDAVFVLNEHDFRFVRQARWVKDDHRIVVLPGTGVDLTVFSYHKPIVGALRVLFIGRLLREKGITEFIEAARCVKRRFPESVFQVLGRFDDNPGAINPNQIRGWVRAGIIDYLGTTTDVRPNLQACNVFCLPSYREGMPRTILEALSTGRAIVTTDVAGCQDTVQHGVNGFLVPPQDSSALAKAIEQFGISPDLMLKFGLASRMLAEARFDVRDVNQIILNVMGLTPAIQDVGRHSAEKLKPSSTVNR